MKLKKIFITYFTNINSIIYTTAGIDNRNDYSRLCPKKRLKTFFSFILSAIFFLAINFFFCFIFVLGQ